MKKLSLYLFLILFCSKAVGQNLVPNPSFEDTIQCPNSPGEINSANHWYSATDATPDYFNSCNGNPIWFSVPDNWVGYQAARTGNGYAGLGIFFNTGSINSREYLEIELNNTLIANKRYIISFFISKADSAPIIATKIGAYLSSNQITQTSDSFLNVIPQIESPSGYYLSDYTNWFEVSDTIIASGNEKYLTIGFFYDDISADTIRAFHINNGLVTDYDGYYYIDDVSIIEDTILSVKEASNKTTECTIFPVPTNNLFYIGSLNEVEGIEIFDHNMNRLKQVSKSDLYDVSDFSSGMYFIKISFKNKTESYKKLIISKN